MQSIFKFLKNLVLDLLYPPFCCGCDQPGRYLCANCYAQIHFFAQPLPLKLEPNYLSQLYSACHYQFPIDQLIKEMKYQSVKALAQVGGQILYQAVNLPPVDLITAVPLHPHRLAERGFNQAAVMAMELAGQLTTPYQPILIRTINTPHQAAITERNQRLQQLQSCFQVQPALIQQLAGRSVLLVDDVTTTGTTLNQCAKELLNGGASQVIGLTLAHGG